MVDTSFSQFTRSRFVINSCDASPSGGGCSTDALRPPEVSAQFDQYNALPVDKVEFKLKQCKDRVQSIFPCDQPFFGGSCRILQWFIRLNPSSATDRFSSPITPRSRRFEPALLQRLVGVRTQVQTGGSLRLSVLLREFSVPGFRLIGGKSWIIVTFLYLFDQIDIFFSCSSIFLMIHCLCSNNQSLPEPLSGSVLHWRQCACFG